MFDIVVVALLFGLTLLAVTRFPAEGGSSRSWIRSRAAQDTDVCSGCRASLSSSDRACLTCGRSVGHEFQSDSVIR